jgi:predicted dehydrogenase
MDDIRIGVIGCGNISTTYFSFAPLFRGLRVTACADANPAAAAKRAAEFGVAAATVEGLLADPAIDLVINLTVPEAHFAVSLAAVEAGKHVYSEKPLTLSLAVGLALKAAAEARGLSVGCAPDTFMGGAHQQAREIVDSGRIGRVTAGTAHVMSHGMEHWHPNPDFFFLPGGGPMLDLGPYYIANLVNLLGPVRRVAALATAATPTRTILTEGPRRGEAIPVGTPTNIHALLDFTAGATITLSTSWDVWAHRHGSMELYGTEGTVFLPDPNFFGGRLETAGRDGDIAAVEPWEHPLGVPNQEHPQGARANYRSIGLADMVAAIREGRDARCSLDRALHGVDVMTSILKSAETGQFVDLVTTCTRPEAFGASDARALMAERATA